MLAVQALATGSKSTRLLWTDAPGVTTYKVLRNVTATPGPQVGTVLAGAGGVFNDHNDPTGLTPGTTYYYWLADQNNVLLTVATAVQTSVAPVKQGLARVVQKAIQNWVVALTGLDPESVMWTQQDASKPLKPFVLLTYWGPMPSSQTQWREQANEALGDIETYMVQVQVFADPPTSDPASVDAFQMAADLRHSFDDPAVVETMNAAGVGIGSVQGVTDLSAALETKFEQRAMLEFGINVGVSTPINVPYTIDTVAPPVGTVTN